MARRYSGTLRINVRFADNVDNAGRGEYAGSISVPLDDGKRRTWKFNKLFVHCAPGRSYDHPDTFDRAAEFAIGFASYYTTENRGDEDELPDWVPAPEVADAIDTKRLYPLDNDPLTGIKHYSGESAVIFRSERSQTKFIEELEKVHG